MHENEESKKCGRLGDISRGQGGRLVDISRPSTWCIVFRGKSYCKAWDAVFNLNHVVKGDGK